MPAPKTTDARRAQIVNALHSLLGSRGYDGASIAAIASEAGLAPGLVHYHFANKEEILLGVVDKLARQLDERMEALLAAAPAPLNTAAPAPPTSNSGAALARLDAWIDAHVALGDGADPASVAAWVAIGAEALRRPAVQEAYEAAVRADLDRGEALVAAIAPQGSAPAAPRTVAVALLSAIEGAYRLAAAAPGAVPAGFAAPSVRRMARGLLGLPGDTP